MKYIKKGKQPSSLNAKRSTKNSSYDAPQKDWQEALLEEQGHICAYCMRRISLDRKNGKPCIEIEHYLSQKLHSELSLRWKNMIGVCNGDTVSEGHCDKAKGKNDYKGVFVQGKANGKVKLNILNPLEISKSEKIITYSLFGEILPNVNVKDNELQNKIIKDVDCILNLNNEKLRESRADAIDSAKRTLMRKYPTGNWTTKQFDEEIKIWKSKDKDGKYKPFCQAAIWWLEKKRAKPIHKS